MNRYEKREDDMHVLVNLLAKRREECLPSYTRRELVPLLQWGHARLGMAFTTAAATRHIVLDRRSYQLTARGVELARRVRERRRLETIALFADANLSALLALRWHEVHEEGDGSLAFDIGRTHVKSPPGGNVSELLRVQRDEQKTAGTFAHDARVFEFGGIV